MRVIGDVDILLRSIYIACIMQFDLRQRHGDGPKPVPAAAAAAGDDGGGGGSGVSWR